MPPPPPPPGPPPPPSAAKLGSLGGGTPNDNRSALLKSIEQGKRLKKTVTNDRSAPVLGGKSRSVPAQHLLSKLYLILDESQMTFFLSLCDFAVTIMDPLHRCMPVAVEWAVMVDPDRPECKAATTVLPTPDYPESVDYSPTEFPN